MTVISLPIQAPKKECNESKNWLSPFRGRKSPQKALSGLLLEFYWLELGHMLIVGPITVKGRGPLWLAQANDVSRLEVGYIAFRNQRKRGMSITYMNEACPISSHWRWLWWKTKVCPLSPLGRTKNRWAHYYSFSFSSFQVDLASCYTFSTTFSPTSHQPWS